jgi:hypothetical protein
MEKVRKRSTEFEQKRMLIDAPIFIPKIGLNLIRILPPWAPDREFWQEMGVHWGIGPNSDPYCCYTYLNQSCPICHYVNAIKATDPEGAARMRVVRRFFLNIANLNTDRVEVWNCSSTMLQHILRFFNNPDWGDLTHPERGYDIILERAGSGLDTKYTFMPKRNPSPIRNPQWLDQIIALDKAFIFPPVDELRIFFEEPKESVGPRVSIADTYNKLAPTLEQTKTSDATAEMKRKIKELEAQLTQSINARRG